LKELVDCNKSLNIDQMTIRLIHFTS